MEKVEKKLWAETPAPADGEETLSVKVTSGHESEEVSVDFTIGGPPDCCGSLNCDCDVGSLAALARQCPQILARSTTRSRVTDNLVPPTLRLNAISSSRDHVSRTWGSLFMD